MEFRRIFLVILFLYCFVQITTPRSSIDDSSSGTVVQRHVRQAPSRFLIRLLARIVAEQFWTYDGVMELAKKIKEKRKLYGRHSMRCWCSGAVNCSCDDVQSLDDCVQLVDDLIRFVGECPSTIQSTHRNYTCRSVSDLSKSPVTSTVGEETSSCPLGNRDCHQSLQRQTLDCLCDANADCFCGNELDQSRTFWCNVDEGTTQRTKPTTNITSQKS